jgi:hypothetical protein
MSTNMARTVNFGTVSIDVLDTMAEVEHVVDTGAEVSETMRLLGPGAVYTVISVHHPDVVAELRVESVIGGILSAYAERPDYTHAYSRLEVADGRSSVRVTVGFTDLSANPLRVEIVAVDGLDGSVVTVQVAIPDWEQAEGDEVVDRLFPSIATSR